MLRSRATGCHPDAGSRCCMLEYDEHMTSWLQQAFCSVSVYRWCGLQQVVVRPHMTSPESLYWDFASQMSRAQSFLLQIL